MFGHSLIILHEKVQYILIVYIYTRACITSILQYHQTYDGKNNSVIIILHLLFEIFPFC